MVFRRARATSASAECTVRGAEWICKRTKESVRNFPSQTKSIIGNSASGGKFKPPEKAAPPGTSCSADASEARIVHGRPGRPPSSEAGLTFRTDRPRAEDPGRSGRSELSGSGDCPATCER